MGDVDYNPVIAQCKVSPDQVASDTYFVLRKINNRRGALLLGIWA